MERIPWEKGIFFFQWINLDALKLSRHLELSKPALNCSVIQKTSAGHSFVSYFQYDIVFSLFPLFSMDLGISIITHRNSRLKGKVLLQPWPLFWVIRLEWLRSVGMSPNQLLDHITWHEGGCAICPVMGSVKNNVFIPHLSCFRALEKELPNLFSTPPPRCFLHSHR